MTFSITKYYKILENITIFFGTDEEEEQDIYTITEALFRPREAL